MAEEQQTSDKSRWQKRQLILALVTTALLAILVGTLAWLNYSRTLQTMTRVYMPVLTLQGGKGQSTAEINMGNIDVTNGTEKVCVFSVVSTEDTNFILQLAHTTNIPFTYSIHPATWSNDQPTTGSYVQEGSGYYSYTDSNTLSGGYLNQDTNTQIANQDRHSTTYGEYNSVQKNAEPLYWRSTSTSITAKEQKYYVLKLKWDNNLENNKETDMVYLTVKDMGPESQSAG